MALREDAGFGSRKVSVRPSYRTRMRYQVRRPPPPSTPPDTEIRRQFLAEKYPWQPMPGTDNPNLQRPYIPPPTEEGQFEGREWARIPLNPPEREPDPLGSERLSALALYYGERPEGRGYVPSGGDEQLLNIIPEQMFKDMTADARMRLMNVPTRSYLPFGTNVMNALTNVLGLGEVGGLYNRGTGRISMNPVLEEHPELREQTAAHEAVHAWDAIQRERMGATGERLPLLQNLRYGGPGAVAIGELLTEDERQDLREGYGPSWMYKPAELYTEYPEQFGFDFSALPSQTRAPYEGLIREDVLNPEPQPPLSIEELRLKEQLGITWDTYFDQRERILEALNKVDPDRAEALRELMRLRRPTPTAMPPNQ